jgi:hypothetical protein
MSFLVYSPSRFSYMGWTLAAQGGVKPCYSADKFESRAAAEELAARVGDGVVVPVTPATAPVAAQEEAYW